MQSKVTAAKADLLSELRRMIVESGGEPDAIDLSAWLDAWLKEPLNELAGAKRSTALRNRPGREQLRAALQRMRGGLPG